MSNLDATLLPQKTASTGAEQLVAVENGVEVGLRLNGVLGLLPSEATLAAGDAAVISTRLTVFSGRTAATAATIPAASGNLRELRIQNANTSSGAVTVTSPSTNIRAAGSASASATNVIAIATCATFLSDGTNWYRVTT